jgi:hypothetical protein
MRIAAIIILPLMTKAEAATIALFREDIFSRHRRRA